MVRINEYDPHIENRTLADALKRVHRLKGQDTDTYPNHT
jgi:hypothetical protein